MTDTTARYLDRTLAFDDVPERLRGLILAEAARVEQDVLKSKGLRRRTILVVGGGGYIGLPLTQHLLERGYRVRCLDLLLYKSEEAVSAFLGHPDYEFVRGDLASRAVAEAALTGVSDVLILAGLVGDPITKKYPAEHQAINEDGLARFIDLLAGRGLNKVVLVSTCSNYGEIPADATADESYELKPLSLYSKAKVAREGQLLAQKGKVDYCPTILRFATAFGLSARMRFDLTVSEFTRDLYAGKALEVYDADTWRPYCHVRDFARALTRVLEMPPDAVGFEVFNAGGAANNFTKRMIVETVLKHLPQGQVRYVAGGADRRNYRVDFTKIQRALGFVPLVSVEDGVRELIAALASGFYADYEQRLSYYRNLDFTYTPPEK